MKIIRAIAAFIVAVLVLIFGFGSWGTVDPGHRGVVVRMGAVTGEVKGEGIYSKTPWLAHIVEMDVRVQKEQVETEGASKDLQTVHAAVALNLALQPDQCANVYQKFGMDYLNTIVAPAMQESIKAVIAQFTAEELITKREVVREAVRILINAKLSPMGIRTEAVNIVNFQFSKSFNDAIEAKVTAEQSALAAKNKLAQIEFEAQQKVAEAKGKAEAMRVESIALANSPQILQLRGLEKWNGILPTVIGSGAPIPFIGVK